MQRIALALTVASALSAAGCTSTARVNASKEQLNLTARTIVSTSLIGARGATPVDQDKIDDTVAGLCGARVWTKEECSAHDAAR
ncbi:hypothetical protein [Ensifer adhaerens]|uniref:hypothetical protein n=1 Tax=Ensifer adhaerens TaxID=106592 RepID=UPI00132EBED5|nr:hypothetical protein [Ensifer adhaerens]QHG70142.1 hypothetical protein DQW09_09915 [Ensifer adhaerens]